MNTAPFKTGIFWKTLVLGAILTLPMVAFPQTEAVALPAPATDLTFEEFLIPEDKMCEIRNEWVDTLLAEHGEGTWAPMKVDVTDSMLEKMGLPPREVLLRQRYPVPTMIHKDGTLETVDISPLMTTTGTMGPTVTSYAGTGCFGIRPGAWLLLLEGGSIGWCSFAHVYGNPGSYSISTAGHCGKTGDVATVIAAFGNRNGVLNPILLDIGKFSKSTGDGGIGKDWALIGVESAWQGLVSPTMCFWGGPQGMYTKTGSTVAATLLGRKLVDGPYVNADPFLVQGIVHYGHGTGVGATGTPRAGTAFHWATTHFSWEGVISPGDSGSGSNTITGDSVGAIREAAGINTHIYVDPTLKTGIGFMAGTRATAVTATLANGQLLPYPVPVPIAP